MANYIVKYTIGDGRPKSRKVWAESVTEAESAVKKVLPQEAVIVDVGREHDIPAEGVLRSY